MKLIRNVSAVDLIFLFIGVLVAGPAATQSSPDYCTVDDYVGKPSLIRADDAMMIEILKSGSSGLEITLLISSNEGSPYAVSAFPNKRYAIRTTSCGSSFVDYINNYQNWTNRETLPVQVRAGRFFDTAYDHISIVLPSANATGDYCNSAPTNDHSMEIALYDASTFHTNGDLTKTATTGLSMVPRQMQTAVADFDKDGFDDLFIVNQTQIWVFSATKITDPSQGLSLVTTFALPSDIPGARNTPRVGDLDNDGNLDVAWISGGTQAAGQTYGTPHAVFATICNGSNAVNGCGTTAFNVVLRDASIALTPYPTAGALPFSPGAASLVGDFDVNRAGDEFAVVQVAPSGSRASRTCTMEVYGLDTGIASATELVNAEICDGLDLQLSGGNGFINSLYADSGAFDFYAEGDQVVVLLEECWGQSSSSDKNCYQPDNRTHYAIYSFQSGSSLDFKLESQTHWESNHWAGGLAFGRYGGTSDITSSATQADFQVQSAVIAGPFFGVWGAKDPGADDFSLIGEWGWQELDYSQTVGGIGQANLTGGSSIYAGDLLGRSQLLGPVQITRVAGHSQPSVVLGVPPMHYDAINLSGGSDLSPVNFTGFVPGYSAGYDFDAQSSTSSSTTATTSWTKSTTESGSVGLKLGAFSASNKETFQQSSTNINSTMNYSSSSQSNSVDSATVVADKILFRSNQISLYTYRLIGQTDCPASDPDCSPQQPAYVTFSGSELADGEASFVPGSQVEWYQPATQPGNVFSYPANQRLLEDRLPGGSSNNSPLATTDSFTTSGGQSAKISLTSQSGSSQTVGSTTNNSFTSKSSVGVKSFVSAGGSFTYESSTSNSTLNTSTEKLAATTGVTVNAAGPFLGAALNLYDYEVGPYLYGTWSQAPQTLSPDTDVTTTGTLGLLYTADPTNAGSWWTSQAPYAVYPDVAINHPTQWCIGSAIDCAASGTPASNQCINAGQVENCAFFQDADAESVVWDNDFYSMRGLFVLDNASNSVADVMTNGPAGSQLANAVAGDVVTLAARVHNLSLVGLDDATVYVQFYTQLITDLTNHALDPDGATLLATVEIPATATPNGAIPPFCGSASPGCNPSSVPDNFVYAATTFDTTDYAGENLTFWVVVWAEDANGDLITELPGHGLSTVPTTTVGQKVDLTSAIDFETYSNNIGFFRYAFPVISEVPDPCANGEEPQVLEVSTSPTRILRGDRVKVSASLLSPEVHRSYVEVFFTERHTKRLSKHGRWDDSKEVIEANVFDYELLGHLEAERPTEARVVYRPNECGWHEIEARTGSETATTKIYVSCKVRVCHKGRETLEVDEQAVEALLRQGDELGACEKPNKKWGKERDRGRHAKVW